jgi:hypothetical protein
MIRAMGWLVNDAQANDALFFHYSGEHARISNTHPRVLT